jgi:DNA polymerase-3 subunit alpha
MPVTQFNMKWVEQAGLVKFDFLGLKTLTVLQTAVALVRQRGIEIDLLSVPLDDRKTFEMLAHGETVGVFQVESQGMRRALVDMRPDRFEDLIVLVALYRPGPMANIPTYCARKLGQEEIEYLHPKLQPILEPTYGIITYQEQVQQIARDLAGYSLAEADLLRRAMGKKIKAEMDAQRGRFLGGAVERGVDKAIASTVFDACAKFAEYGFNKSHSAPYALLTYQTAYMKANYPVEFMAASMTLDINNTDKLAEFRGEAQRLGIKVEPPSVNCSGAAFDVAGGTLRYALAALKGVGGQTAESIVAARGESPFRDLADFAERINPRAVNKRVLESLAAAGAFDALEANRARVFAGVDLMLSSAQRTFDAQTTGQTELFGGPVSGGLMARVPLALPSLEACRLKGCRRNSRRSDSFSPATRSMTMRARSSGCASSPGPNLPAPSRQARAAGASPARSSHGSNGAPVPATRWASSSCRIRRGISKQWCFPKGSRSSATSWNPAAHSCSRSRPSCRAMRCGPASRWRNRSTRPPPSCRRAYACSCGIPLRSRASPSGSKGLRMGHRARQ